MEIQKYKLRYDFLYFFVCLFLLFPSLAFAANVGFVPSTGIWFSRTEFQPNETIRIFTVVINNDYYLLNGTVAFYDNNNVIDTVEVQNLPKEAAKEIRVFWVPSEGEHAVSARFIKAVAVDEKGAQQQIDISAINSVAGAPLSVNDGSITSVVDNDPQKVADQLAVFGAPTPSSTVLGEVQLMVKRSGSQLAIAPAPQVAGVKISGASSAATSSEGNQANNSSDDPFAQNRDILSRAEAVAGTVTTTAGQIQSAYSATQNAINTGKSWYSAGQTQWGKVSPYVDQAMPYWLQISNNNDPKRIAIIAGAVVVLWLFIKWRLRRRWYQRFER